MLLYPQAFYYIIIPLIINYLFLKFLRFPHFFKEIIQCFNHYSFHSFYEINLQSLQHLFEIILINLEGIFLKKFYLKHTKTKSH